MIAPPCSVTIKMTKRRNMQRARLARETQKPPLHFGTAQCSHPAVLSSQFKVLTLVSLSLQPEPLVSPRVLLIRSHPNRRRGGEDGGQTERLSGWGPGCCGAGSIIHRQTYGLEKKGPDIVSSVDTYDGQPTSTSVPHAAVRF